MKKGSKQFPDCISLLTCLGEIQAQAGNPSAALSTYALAAKLDPSHPLPYLNAAHVYQQLNQPQLARMHAYHALSIDTTLSLTLVDIAQAKVNDTRNRLLNYKSVIEAENGSSMSQNTEVVSNFTVLEHKLNEQSSMEILDCAISSARHASEVIDIFTAKQICQFYNDLISTAIVPCIQ
jgi:tetratricopeptide (TPR) repeat protein